MTEPYSDPAAMTAMLTGFVFASLQDLKKILRGDISWESVGVDGTIGLILPDGMAVSITIKVEPMP